MSANANSVVMRPEWLIAIGKAASSIRFTAGNWDWMSEPARQESLRIATTLTEIENAFFHGYTHSKVVATLEGHVAEEEFYDANGKVIGYWAYGAYDPTYPFQG